ncbi:MAG TPA: hypothetical protein VF635_09245 [Propionibacteriaceae bacterium]
MRIGTSDAEAAQAQVHEADVTLHNEEVLRIKEVAPMSSFSDLESGGLVSLDKSEPTEKVA